ncbi:DUF4880 domain-containing protein [Steroidobacter sp. S1-65]|uniref:DUF4880 domain-containing protein n=1 Tax=Steroidobacter gossypii TaxID=2805490 RepID=A0ABS1X0N7_9GAMM|nr:DUF4880 domain-containing protein [Steroidobacter gossypii]MBM0106773.1 DUF4880 domain-containing protein [Steroidobacter gossypii]
MQTSAATERRVVEQAAYWFIRGTDEQLDAADRSEYLRWLRHSPNNIAEMLQVAAYIGKLRKLQLIASTLSADSNIVELDARSDAQARARPHRR